MDRVAFTFDGKPQGKARHRTTKFGRSYTPAKTAAAEKAIGLLYRAEARSLPIMTGTVQLKVEAIFDIPKSWSKADRAAALDGSLEYTGKPDADNILKLVMDALNGVAWVDDSQVHPDKPVRRYGVAARTEVIVEHESTQGRKSPAERRREQKVNDGMVGRKKPQRRLERNSSASTLRAIGRRIR